MRFLSAILLITTSSALAQAPTTTWYKGNLHTHSYWSDGDEFPERIMEWYKSKGYHFVGLSDHNILAEGEKWKKIQRSKMYEDALKEYLAKYGETVNYKVDSGRYTVRLKTLAEYRPLFEDRNFLLIKSEEITSRLGDKHIHVNATNIQRQIGAQTGATVVEVMQSAVNSVLAQRKETGVPMFPHINHPNFYYSITVDDMISLKGERFFEVYNGHPLVHNYGDSLHPGMEAMWDRINIAYKQRGQPLMFGLGTDDSHNYHQFGTAFSNAGRGWVMVRANALTPEALITALEAGDFYASSGVELEDVSFTNGVLEVKVKAEAGVTYTIEFIGVQKAKTKASVFKSVKGISAQFTVSKSHLFVRVRVTSSKLKENPFQEGDHENGVDAAGSEVGYWQANNSRMKKYVIPKLVGLSILTMITLVIISFIEVALYSYLVNPGQDQSAYEAHAQVSAPYISGIFGFIVFFLVARYWRKKAIETLPRLVILFPLTYVLLDLTMILLIGGVDWSSFALIFGLANGAKFLGCYLGYKLS